MAKKITKRKSTPEPSPLAAVLEQLVVPAFEAESEPQDNGPSFGMTASAKSREAFTRFITACRVTLTADAASFRVHPSRSLQRIIVPRQSNSMG